MCTVTIVRLPGDPAGGFRFACNRDELRTRRPARGPERRTYGDRSAVHPVDQDAGGTWVGANDAGLALSLLNLNLETEGAQAARPRPPLSRGAIIPALLHHDRVGPAVAEALRLDPAAQKPFRLILADRAERAVVRSDGRTITVAVHEANDTPFMITSSGLGDHLVEGPRRAIFDRLFGGSVADPVTTQDAFHRTHESDVAHLSVSMDRPEALTMSHTVVTVSDDVSLAHLEVSPHRATDADMRAMHRDAVHLDSLVRTAG